MVWEEIRIIPRLRIMTDAYAFALYLRCIPGFAIFYLLRIASGTLKEESICHKPFPALCFNSLLVDGKSLPASARSAVECNC